MKLVTLNILSTPWAVLIGFGLLVVALVTVLLYYIFKVADMVMGIENKQAWRR